MNFYDRIFRFFWTPVRFVAGLLLTYELFPKWAPWILAARLGRWPKRIPDEEINPEDLSLLSPEDRDLVLRRR